MRSALLLLITPVVLATAPVADAKASVYCVAPRTGCADGYFSTVQAALDTATMHAGPDEVHLGATIYTTSSGFTYDDNGTSTNTVAISGVGRSGAFADSNTTLTRTTNGPILQFPTGASVHNSVSNLEFHMTNANSSGAEGQADATRVAVIADGAVANSQGLALGIGSAQDVGVKMPPSGGNIGISTTGSVSDSTVVADQGVVFPGSLQRSDVTGAQAAITMQSGTIDDVVARVTGSGSPRFGLDAHNEFGGTNSLMVRHLTLVGDGTPGSYGIRVRAEATGGSRAETVDVRNSIVRDVEKSFQRAGTTGGSNVGTANLDVHYTDYDPATGDQSGPGTGPDPNDPTNLNADPVFVDQANGNLRLRSESPLVDRGDPAGLAAGEPGTDSAGDPRVVNGRRDIGALEYQRQPPFIVNSPSTNRPAAPTGVPFRFGVLAGDHDFDTLSYGWTFDDGASATGVIAEHAFARAGMHVATATVTDSTGLTASAQVTVTVLPNPRTILTALSISPKKFRAGTGRKKGTTVRFTLKLPSKVTFRAVRMPGSHKVKGSFTRKGVLGKNTFRFAGKMRGKKLKPGKYRLVATVGKGRSASIRRAAFTIKR